MRRMAWITSVVSALAAGSLAVAGPLAAAGPVAEQSIELRPGWNAVFLEVQPERADMATVFGSLPVASVWSWSPGTGRIEYVRDPGETLADQPGWRVWFPAAAGAKAVLSNLHAVGANQSYLVEVTGDQTRTLTVSGRPTLRRPAWERDSFNLTGFPVDPANPPTFGAFFAASPAHAGQAIYRLEGGAWRLVAAGGTERIRPGEAFWVYAKGASTFAGPLQVSLDYGDELDFGSDQAKRSLRIRNVAALDRTVSLAGAAGAGALPVSRLKVGDDGIGTWPDLGADSQVTVHGGTEKLVRLAVRRTDISSGSSAGLLVITDGEGSLLRIPFEATAPLGAGGELDHTGLWIGTVNLAAVTEAQIPARPEFVTPQPVGFPFSFKVLVHVDGDGRARLLKEVIQMLDTGDGTSSPRPVLLTDDTLVSSYQPLSLVGGEPFSHRISTAGYDFAGRSLVMGGTFSLTGALTCRIDVPASLPTNPFLHANHPDHDNLDPLDRPITNARVAEVYAVTRDLVLSFSATDTECAGVPGCTGAPDWGDTRMGGTFQETIKGLHRNDVKVAGTFALRRVTDTAQLIPAEVAP